jgi:hypothetical protein
MAGWLTLDPLRNTRLTLFRPLKKHLADKRFITDTDRNNHDVTSWPDTWKGCFLRRDKKSWCHGGLLACMSVVTVGTPSVHHLLPFSAPPATLQYPLIFDVTIKLSASKCWLLYCCHICTFCLAVFGLLKIEIYGTSNRHNSVVFCRLCICTVFQWDLHSHCFKALIAICCT